MSLERFEAMESGAEQSDSAGRTWRGRQITDTGFGSDDGSADPVVTQALREPHDERELMRALADARFLVPIVADATEVVQDGSMLADKAADMAVAVLVAPDGTRALPVFTSLETLHAWDASARPSPVTAAHAAQAAVSERADIIVLDVAGPATVALRPSMVWALAMQREWVPSHADPRVISAVEEACRDEPKVARSACEAGEDGSLRIALYLVPGVAGEEISAIAQRIAEHLATDGEVRARIDAVTFAARPADND